MPLSRRCDGRALEGMTVSPKPGEKETSGGNGEMFTPRLARHVAHCYSARPNPRGKRGLKDSNR